MSQDSNKARGAEESGEDTNQAVDPVDARGRAEAGEVHLVDVRTRHEWDAGRIPGAQHIPLAELSGRTEEIPSDRPVLIYCRGGNRSEFAALGLKEAGLDARAIAGGALGWEEAGLPLEPEGGYVSESGEASAILEARARNGSRPAGIPY